VFVTNSFSAKECARGRTEGLKSEKSPQCLAASAAEKWHVSLLRPSVLAHSFAKKKTINKL